MTKYHYLGAVLCLLLIATGVYGGEVRLSFDAPTKKEDGSVLPFEQIQGYNVRYYCNERGPFWQWVRTGPNPRIVTLTNGVWGTCRFQVRTFATYKEPNSDNHVRSKWSNEVTKLVPLDTPTNFRIIDK